jgi:hypothetical protein
MMFLRVITPIQLIRGHRLPTCRWTGLALAIFLPLHFLTLGLAIHGEAPLESFMRWSDQRLVKLADSGLVFLLVVHAGRTAAIGDRESSLAQWTERARYDRGWTLGRHRVHPAGALVMSTL